VLQRLKRLDDALASYDRALQLKPDDAEAFNNRGTALSELQREEEAVASYAQALALRPGYVGALHNQALSLMTLRRFEEAARSLERLLALDADHPFAQGKLLHAQMQCCDWQQIAARAEHIRRGIQAGKEVADPFDYLAISESAHDLRRCAEICAPITYSWHGARCGARNATGIPGSGSDTCRASSGSTPHRS
jgi:tetratricopeptide (TPR) repeat protein